MTETATRKIIGEAAAAAVERSTGEQLAFPELAPPSRLAPGSLGELPPARRIGRPLGARNIATRQVIDFVRRAFGDPMIESARWLTLTPQAMAQELRCSLIEAWDRQERVRADLRRFMYAPLAAVDGAGQAVVPRFELRIGAAAAGDAVPPWLIAPGIEIEENQEVSAAGAEQSHGEQSHNGAK